MTENEEKLNKPHNDRSLQIIPNHKKDKSLMDTADLIDYMKEMILELRDQGKKMGLYSSTRSLEVTLDILAFESFLRSDPETGSVASRFYGDGKKTFSGL